MAPPPTTFYPIESTDVFREIPWCSAPVPVLSFGAEFEIDSADIFLPANPVLRRDQERRLHPALFHSFATLVETRAEALGEDYSYFFSQMFRGFPDFTPEQRVLGYLMGGAVILGAVALGGLALAYAAPAVAGMAIAAGGIGAGGFLAPSSVAGGALLVSTVLHVGGLYLLSESLAERDPWRDHYVEIARNGLEAWREHPEQDFNFHDFLWGTELHLGSRRGDAAYLRQTTERSALLLTAMEAANDPELSAEARIADVRRQLFLVGGMRLYNEFQARMAGILDGIGGNCDAETKLFLALFSQLNLTLPEPLTFGVQLYEHHLQLVVYNRESGEVWNLITGRRGTEIRGPIFDTHVFLHSFLVAEGEASPVTEEELLIVPANAGEYADPLGSTRALEEIMSLIHVQWEDILFSYPQVDETFVEGEIPDYTILPMPEEGVTGSSERNVHSVPETRPRMEAASAQGYNFAAWGRRAHMMQTRLRAHGYLSIYNDEEDDPYLTILSDAEELGRFTELATRQEQEAFLLTLTHGAFMERLASAEMQELLEFLDHPETCAYRSADEFERWRELTIDIFHLSESLGEELDSNFFRNSPYLAPFHRDMLSFRRWLREHPETLVNLLVEMEGPWRRAFFSMLRDFSGFQFGNIDEEETELLPLTPFAELLSQISIAPAAEEPREEEVPATVPLTEESGSWNLEGSIEVELTYLPESLSAEAYFDALTAVLSESLVDQETGWNLVSQNWNTEWSREFLRLNADGRYDQIWRVSFGLAYCRRREAGDYCSELGGPWIDFENLPEEIPEDLRLIHEDYLIREPHLPYPFPRPATRRSPSL